MPATSPFVLPRLSDGGGTYLYYFFFLEFFYNIDFEGCTNVVVELIKYGADVNVKQMMGQTPLIFSIVGGHMDTAVKLIELGANLDIINDRGDTALIFASTYGKTHMRHECVNLFLCFIFIFCY